MRALLTEGPRPRFLQAPGRANGVGATFGQLNPHGNVGIRPHAGEPDEDGVKSVERALVDLIRLRIEGEPGRVARGEQLLKPGLRRRQIDPHGRARGCKAYSHFERYRLVARHKMTLET